MANSEIPEEGTPLERRDEQARAGERDEQADGIIRSHMNYAMMGSAIPIPLLDLTALTAVQLDMIKKLAQVYVVPFDARASRSFLMSLASAMTGRWLARFGAASIAKLIPGVGFLAGGAASALLNGAFTYAVGTAIQRHFAKGQPIDELDVRSIKDELVHLVETGRERAAAMFDKIRDQKKAKP
jgi:uncharacterized protein (DUF697 family)